MELSERQYERVARFLDGEPIELTGAERELAAEIRRLERELPAMLEVRPPGEAMDRAQRRMMGGLRRPRRHALRFVAPVGAAAAIVVAVAAVWLWLAGRTTPPSPPPDIYARADDDVDLNLLAEELDELEAEIVASLSGGPLEAELDALQQALDGFWVEEVDRWPGEN